jgi:hypothetical protein
LKGLHPLTLLLVITASLVQLAFSGQVRKNKLDHRRSLIVSTRVGDVSRLDGEVRSKQRGEANPRELQVGDKLSEGDIVLTGAQSRAEWSLGPDSYFQVGGESQVRLYETLDEMHFDIERGEVFVIVSSLDKGEVLELDTPHALLTVARRGRYRIRVSKNGDTEATVVQGELRFVNSKGEAGRVTTRKQIHFFLPKN